MLERRSGLTALVAGVSALMLLGADHGDPGLPGPTVLEWEVLDCDAVLAAVPVHADALGPHMPPGFTPATPEEFGLPPHPDADAVLGVKTLRCAEGTTLEGRTSPMEYGAIWSPAHPPEELADPDIWFHFVAWDTLVPDEERRDFLSEWGLPVHDGEADLSGFIETPAGITFSVSLTMGPDTYAIEGASLLPADDFSEPARYTDFMAGDGGELSVWRATSENDEIHAGAGTVRFPDGGWAAEVAGGSVVDAMILASSTVSFADGSVTFPREHPSQRRDHRTAEADAAAHAPPDELPATGGAVPGVALVLVVLGAVLVRSRTRSGGSVARSTRSRAPHA